MWLDSTKFDSVPSITGTGSPSKQSIGQRLTSSSSFDNFVTLSLRPFYPIFHRTDACLNAETISMCGRPTTKLFSEAPYSLQWELPFKFPGDPSSLDFLLLNDAVVLFWAYFLVSMSIIKKVMVDSKNTLKKTQKGSLFFLAFCNLYQKAQFIVLQAAGRFWWLCFKRCLILMTTNVRLEKRWNSSRKCVIDYAI